MIESNTSWDLTNVIKWCTLKSLFTHCPIVEMKGPTSWKFKAEERKGLEVQFKVRFDYNLLHNQFIHFSSYSCFVYDAFFYFSSWFLLLRCKTSKCKPKKINMIGRIIFHFGAQNVSLVLFLSLSLSLLFSLSLLVFVLVIPPRVIFDNSCSQLNNFPTAHLFVKRQRRNIFLSEPRVSPC